MGLTVVGLAVMDYSFWFYILNTFVKAASEAEKVLLITTTMVTFGIGASLQALFARVGGGIFTKAADVGADLVGKVEAGIPEDDPRNPATIADNVGDNVGDVAGMGADLYESYYGSILAAASLGALAFFNQPQLQWNAVLAPVLMGALGIFLSLGGIFFVKVGGDESGKAILKALDRGIHVAAIGLIICSYFLLNYLGLGAHVWGALVSGLITGIERKKSRSGEMAFVSLQDKTGEIEIIVFSDIFTKNSELMINGTPITVSGEVSFKEEEDPKIIAKSVFRIGANLAGSQKQIKPDSPVMNNEAPKDRKIYLRVGNMKSPVFRRVDAIINIFPGQSRVIVYETDNGKYSAISNKGCSDDAFVIAELKELLGDENVIIK